MQVDPPSTRAQLLTLLQSGRALTQAEIAEQLDVSLRHARRLIRQLREADVPVQARNEEQGKTFYLPPSALAVEGAPVPLTERQALAVVVAAEAGRAALRSTPLADPLADGFEQLLHRLDRASGTYDLSRLRDQWHFGTEPTASNFDASIFDTLLDALNERRPVRIEYESASSSDAPRRRTVSPLVMAAPGGSWRCVAYCHYREAPRDFTLSRIEKATLCLEESVPDAAADFDLELYFRERFGALSGEPRVVRLRVAPEAARFFREKDYHPTQVIESEQDDGRLVVSFEVAGLKDMASWVRSWGTSVTVLAPPELAEHVVEEARRVVAQYEKEACSALGADEERPAS